MRKIIYFANVKSHARVKREYTEKKSTIVEVTKLTQLFGSQLDVLYFAVGPNIL